MNKTKREFERLLKLALARGWHIPNPLADSHGPEPWMGYWRALEVNDEAIFRNADARPGRPVPPHTPGRRGPEDALQRAERHNQNRELWRGYLT